MDTGGLARRVYPRRLLQGKGEIVDVPSGAVYAVNLLDISMGGVAFLSPAQFREQSLWLLRFTLDGFRLSGNIRIAYCMKHSLADTYRVGAEFKRFGDDNLAVVQRYIERDSP